jgi:hypothetical protein
MTDTQQRRSGGNSEAAATDPTTNASVAPYPASLLLHAEVGRILSRVDSDMAVRMRAVQESLNDALACTWRRKADLFEWARPRAGEFTGDATPDELAERDRKLAAQAAACRHKAELLELRILDDFEGEL